MRHAIVLAAVLAAVVVTAAGRAPAQTATSDTWGVHGLVDGQPAIEDVEIPLGGSRAFGIGSAKRGRVGSHLAMPYDGPPLRDLRWVVEPAGRGVEISPRGVVTVRPQATPGSYTVKATASGESRTHPLLVFDPKRAPIVGTWTEKAQIACDGGQEIVPAGALRELIFDAGGSFSATWLPFETRKDYWGTYTHNVESGALAMTVSDGNYKPDDLVTSGTATIDGQRRLVLKGIWLGTAPMAPPAGASAAARARNCGHIFASQTAR